LKTKGRYATSGAIRDPNVSLDMRDLYLKDIKMFGCTEWDLHIFPNLISYIEKNEFRPIIYKEYHIQRIKEAQEEFLKKNHIGKISLFF
jgi:NADPH:quinone reductase-like Zn-dependent oxidoreductase